MSRMILVLYLPIHTFMEDAFLITMAPVVKNVHTIETADFVFMKKYLLPLCI